MAAGSPERAVLGRRPRVRWSGAAGRLRPTDDESAIGHALLGDIAAPEHRDRAAHCAMVQGVSALDALIACTAADPDAIARRLGARLGLGVLERIDFAADTLPATAAVAAMQSGILRLPDGGFVVCLRGRPVAEVVRLLGGNPQARDRIRIATPAMYAQAVMHAAGAGIAEAASAGPALVDAAFSARASAIAGACVAGAVAIGVAAIATVWLAPVWASLVFGIVFFALAGLRLLGVRPDWPEPPHPRMPDDMLPVFTVLVPLYRESACLDGLIRALALLDYPESKLDLKLLVEAGDRETRTALASIPLPGRFEILVVPDGSPRTKPRALNAGLMAARGSLLGVFDAEDRPEPGQLRAAVDAFRRGGPRLACVQARLAIDNVDDGWLTSIFALEYAGLFDALLPGLSRTGLMFPLGGTSNHFRTAALDRIGGWDAWNVTEDADLGVRLARFGFRARVIASTTFEEAPNRPGAWIRQRTRWLKGYMLTWAVHMRNPGRLFRELGPLNFIAFNVFIGGVPLSALILPIFLAGVADQALDGVWLVPGWNWLQALPYTIDGLNLIVGFGSAIVLAGIGADRRGLRRLSAWLPTVPLYWLLSSVAAWRAVWQLARAPFLWEKTAHGLARTSSGDTPIVPS